MQASAISISGSTAPVAVADGTDVVVRVASSLAAIPWRRRGTDGGMTIDRITTIGSGLENECAN